MPTATIHPSVIAPERGLSHGGRGEYKEQSSTERIWRQTDELVQERLQSARQAIELNGSKVTPQAMMRRAYTRQRHELEGADTDEWTTSQLTANQAALVLLEMPFAAGVQAARDAEPDTSLRERTERVAILSQFNHDFAATLACMPPGMVKEFPEQLWRRGDNLARQGDLPAFIPERYNNVVKGMQYEVAFARALHATVPEGWSVRHATVDEDMAGIDIIVADDHAGSMNFDTKAAAPFHKKVDKLHEQGRLSDDEWRRAGIDGFAYVTYRGRQETTEVCISNANMLGRIEQFEFQDPEVVGKFVEARMHERRQKTLQRIGNHAINI